MNTDAYFEYLENMKYIRKHDYSSQEGDFTVYEVPTEKVTFFGSILKTLGSSGFRKFENILVIRDPKTRLKFRYV